MYDNKHCKFNLEVALARHEIDASLEIYTVVCTTSHTATIDGSHTDVNAYINSDRVVGVNEVLTSRGQVFACQNRHRDVYLKTGS